MRYTIQKTITTTDLNILRERLLKNKDDDVSQYAANNPNCPSDALEFVLRQNKDDRVSRIAAQNPNCTS